MTTKLESHDRIADAMRHGWKLRCDFLMLGCRNGSNAAKIRQRRVPGNFSLVTSAPDPVYSLHSGHERRTGEPIVFQGTHSSADDLSRLYRPGGPASAGPKPKTALRTLFIPNE